VVLHPPLERSGLKGSGDGPFDPGRQSSCLRAFLDQHGGDGVQVKRFPRSGFLVLGVLSLVAAGLFGLRAVIVETTLERMVSMVVYAVVGVFWLIAFRLADHS